MSRDLSRVYRHEGKRTFTRAPVEQTDPLKPASEELIDPGTERVQMEVSETEGEIDAVENRLPMTELDANADPLKPSILPMPSRRKIVRWIRLLGGWLRKRFGKQQLSETERVEAQEMFARKQLEAQLRREAELYIQRITNALNARNLCYRYPKHERDLLNSGIQSVRFDACGMSPDALYLRIDTNRRPRGVGILDLLNEDILTDLSISVGHKVTGHYSESLGALYVVERASGVMGIPVHVKFQDMLDTWPPSADEMTIPLGMSQNSKRVYRSIKSFPHLLIAGSTESGKSNMMNVIIGTLILNNTPEQLKLILVDLKGGMEFTFYEGLPHLVRPMILGDDVISDSGIIYEREQVPNALAWLIHEGERRMGWIRDAGHKNIASYNAHRRPDRRLPRIVLVIDEWADVRLVRGLGSKAEAALSNLASRMRAVGIHVVVATQSPKKEVISTIIKTNLPAKMAFSMPDNTSSMLVLDNGDARGLAPRGRFVFQHGTQSIVQAPFMPDVLIREIVANAIAGKSDRPKTRHDVTIEEVLEWALDHDNGELSIRKLWAEYKDRGVTHKELIEMVVSLDNRSIQVRDNYYSVKKMGRAHLRTLVLADDEQTREATNSQDSA